MLLRWIFAKIPGKELVFNFYYVQAMRITMSKSGAFLENGTLQTQPLRPFESTYKS